MLLYMQLVWLHSYLQQASLIQRDCKIDTGHGDGGAWGALKDSWRLVSLAPKPFPGQNQAARRIAIITH